MITIFRINRTDLVPSSLNSKLIKFKGEGDKDSGRIVINNIGTIVLSPIDKISIMKSDCQEYDFGRSQGRDTVNRVSTIGYIHNFSPKSKRALPCRTLFYLISKMV